MAAGYDQAQAFGGVIDVLEAIGATYAIWGGMAVVMYGEPRFTQDMDILLSPQKFPVKPFVQRLESTHYHVDEQAVQNAVLLGGFFNVIHLHYHIKTDFYVPVEPELKTMIADRQYEAFDEMRQAAYVSATSLVIAKLRAYENSQSTRHLDDIAGLIRIRGSKLEVARIEIAAANLGVLGVWRSLWDTNRPGFVG
ncbi:MAG: hypothetical protein IPL78_28430 [Chloroflexi bacterium]|nr:hypothetical protein [Chloroflexota bacterium]